MEDRQAKQAAEAVDLPSVMAMDTAWTGVNLEAVDAGQLTLETVLPSHHSYGCERKDLPAWRKAEYEAQKFDRTELFVAWLRKEVIRVGNYDFGRISEWWGVSAEGQEMFSWLKHAIRKSFVEVFHIQFTMGDHAFATAHTVTVDFGNAARYLYGCSANLRQTTFYSTLGHEVGHLVANLMRVKLYRPERESDWMVDGEPGEFLARIAQRFIADRFRIQIRIPKRGDPDDWNNLDEHRVFPEADCWYDQDGKVSTPEKRREFLLKFLAVYANDVDKGTDWDKSGIKALIYDQGKRCP